MTINPRSVVRIDQRGTEEQFREQTVNSMTALESKIEQSRREATRQSTDLAVTEWLFWERINGA